MKNRVRAIAAAAFAVLLSLPSAAAHAQTAVLTGKVTAETGSPIEGANVQIVEAGVSVATNAQGIYTTTVPSARVNGQQVVMKVRAIGYAPETKAIALTAGSHTENFTMKLDVNRLSEVVVTGTANGEGVERSKVPFAIARLSSEDIPVPALDPITALQGKIAGVRIASNGGQPGTVPNILIRGPTSINATGRSQGPLIVVDGTLMRNSSLDELGGLDIESVEVVKGAAGATLYGSTGASGVINITTKRGNNRDGVAFSVRSEVGFQDPNSTTWGEPVDMPLQVDETGTRLCVVATSATAPCSKTLDIMREMQRINGVVGDTARANQSVQFFSPSPSAGDLQNVFQANQWPGQYYNTFAQVSTRALTTLNSVDAQGRIGSVRFYVSGQYTDDQGAIRYAQQESNQRARVNLDYDMRSDLLISISTSFNKQIQPNQGQTLALSDILLGMPPGVNALALDTLGRPFVVVGGTGFRPVANGATGSFNNDVWSNGYGSANRFLGNITGTYNPAEWVTIAGTYAYDNRSAISEAYNFKGYRTQTASTTDLGFMQTSNSVGEAMNGNISATLRKQVTSDLNAKLSIAGSGDQQTQNFQNGSGSQFIVKDVFTISNTSTNLSAGSSTQIDRNLGASVALNTDYKDRYILEGALRYDGSSRFGPGNRWAPFGRVSGVWRVSQESWFNVPGITDFRLRASDGTAGKVPSFSAQYETYSCGATGCSLGQAGNKTLKPETTTEQEVGTDLTLFNRLGIELTHVNDVSKNQLLNVPTPNSLGFASQWQNAGTLASTTWELGLNLPVVTKRDFNWSMHGTWDRTRSFITELFMPQYFTSGATAQGTGSFFLITSNTAVQDGYQQNQYGTIWGRKFYKTCADLPASVQTSCGPNKDYQVNDQGWVVWVGAGNSVTDGITKNLWQTKLSAANSPWNYGLYWGMPIVDRPLRGQVGEGVGINHILGSALPAFRLTYGNNIQYKKLTAYALLDGTYGFVINNQMEQWGLLNIGSDYFDQGGKSVELAKPTGYGWRVGGAEGAGIGGFYDVLGPNNHTTESGSYAKLREVSLSYRVGRINAIGGDWTVGIIGRNLYTFTHYSGIDPELGVNGGQASSGLINQTDTGAYPNLRTYTLSFSTRY